jgi:hypothetical protein
MNQVGTTSPARTCLFSIEESLRNRAQSLRYGTPPVPCDQTVTWAVPSTDRPWPPESPW